MTDIPFEATSAIPLTFTVNLGRCFGWFHAARGPTRGAGVVLCRPLGYEAICTYGSYTQLAEALSLEGFDVMRFDYHGTGDSAGDDTDPDRVQSWINGITTAAFELRRLAGIRSVSFFGVRLGATLAAQAAVRIGGVDSLVMWAPCITGRAYVRELRAAGMGRRASSVPAEPGAIEAFGYLYSAQTLEDIKALDCLAENAPPAKRALILGRDDMPGEGPLPAKYRDLGVDTTFAHVSGYAEMMAEPREMTLPAATLDLITQWLGAAHPAQLVPAVKRYGRAASSAQWVQAGVRETAVRFAAGQLFGILAEPAGTPTADSLHETAVILLNVGGNYRIGPSRMYVRLARALAGQGRVTLRLDLPGIGDSRSADGFSMGSLYARDSTAEVSAAIDMLAAKGCTKFFLAGICSGSFVAFQTALVDPRVTGQILMNSRLLEMQDPQAPDGWQKSMQRYYKSMDYYRRSFLNPALYPRLLRGEVDVGGIAIRFLAVLRARLIRSWRKLLHRPLLLEGLVEKVMRLSARGTDTLIIIAAEDDGRDYVEYHFGSMGNRMEGTPRFRMLVVENGDHTFSDLASQQFVIAAIQTHLKELPDLMPPDALPGAPPDYSIGEVVLPARGAAGEPSDSRPTRLRA